MIDNLGIAHVSVRVGDAQRALGFYRNLLGMCVSPVRPDAGYPRAAGPGHDGRGRHTAVLVKDLARVREALRRARIAYTSSRSG